MLVELVCGLLSGISITLLKDAYGPFVRRINSDELIVAAFVVPVEELAAKSIPLEFDSSNHHFLSPAGKTAERNDPAL